MGSRVSSYKARTYLDGEAGLGLSRTLNEGRIYRGQKWLLQSASSKLGNLRNTLNMPASFTTRSTLLPRAPSPISETVPP